MEGYVHSLMTHEDSLQASGLLALVSTSAAALLSLVVSVVATLQGYRLKRLAKSSRDVYRKSHSIQIDGKYVELEKLPDEVVDGLVDFQREDITSI